MLNKFFRPKLIVGSLPVTLTNGTTADATQVMSDLNWIVNQINANAAPLNNPTFTGILNAAAANFTNITASGTITGNAAMLSPITNSLAGDVSMPGGAVYSVGPSIPQGVTGTWFASGTVTLKDTVSAVFDARLWDGTTVIASGRNESSGTNSITISLSGFITNPVANIRISARDITSGNGLICFNESGNSKDSTVTAIRIG